MSVIEGNRSTHGETIVLLLLGESVDGRLMRECDEVVGHDLAVSYVRGDGLVGSGTDPACTRVHLETSARGATMDA